MIDTAGIERILFIKPSSLGDVIHALPAVAALRRRFSQARIDWLVEEEAADIVRGHPAVTEVIVSGRKAWARDALRPRRAPMALGGALGLLRAIRASRYDLAIDLQGLLKSGIVAWLSGARHRLGFARSREGSALFLTHRVQTPEGPVHAVDRYMAVVGALGADTGPRDFTIPVGPEAVARAEALLAEAGRPRVVLHPSARWPTKLWEAEGFARVGDALARRAGASIILTGGPGDRATAAVAASMRAKPLDLTGRLGLKELAAILARADLMVAVDSGPMHIAAALGTPLVALFGPSDPRRTGPYGGRAAILREDLPCAPCLKRRCQIADERLCMRSIGEGAVVDTAIALLQGGRA